MPSMSDDISVPVHVGIIMDGNGRWAVQRGYRRTRGHQEGIEAAKRVIHGAIDLGISYISLYAFSTENWKRTENEVSFIMALVARNLRGQYDFYRENHIRVRHSGNLEGLPMAVQKEIATVREETKNFDRITVNIAINYGGRDEIVRAVNRILTEKDGTISEAQISSALDLSDTPEPDLIIRTGGDRRLSNFLLWECAYSELYFSDRLWPDWSEEDLKAAVEDYTNRKRNYGGNRTV